MIVSAKSFIEECVAGKVACPQEAVLDAIDAWHEVMEGDPIIPLHTWLGMTWEEYARYVSHPKTLFEIIEERKSGVATT